MQTLVFADAWTTGGFWAAFIASGLCAVCALGTTVAAVTDAGGLRRGMIIGTVVLLALTALGGRYIVGRMNRFDALVVGADGRWSLIGPMGRTMHVLPADAMRAVDFERERVDAPRTRVVRGWVRIELPDGRSFESTHAPIDAQRAANRALRALIGQAQGR